MRALRWLDRHAEEAALVALLVAISLVMLAQVIARYVLNDSMSWPEEFCRYCYIWTMFLSLGYTIKKGNMLRVGVVMDLLPPRVQSVVRIAVHAIMFALFAALFRQSFYAVDNIKNVTKEISSAMQLPMWTMYMSAVIGFGVALLRIAQVIVSDCRRFGVRDESTVEATKKEAAAEAESAQRDSSRQIASRHDHEGEASL